MLFYILLVLIIITDFITKKIAVISLKDVSTIPLIQDILHFTYVENRGAAFGILQNQRWIFISISILVVIAIIFLRLKMKNRRLILDFALSFVTGGAIGNLIDRIYLGYVVDFIDFRIIDFPVFNVADIFVVIGAVMIAVFYIFFDKDEQNERK